jgi:predicted nuclease of restriction endonuclease-like RecB superfamily
MSLLQKVSCAVRNYLEAPEDSAVQAVALLHLRRIVQQASFRVDDRHLRLAVFEGAADVDGVSAAFARDLYKRLLAS